MQAIKSRDTSIEIRLRETLWARGIRYRKNYKGLPGKPDIVFVSRKVAVFCDSEFFHGKDWPERKLAIKTNKKYWVPKIERNMERDREINNKLKTMGWSVLRFWGRDIMKYTDDCVAAISAELKKDEAGAS